MGNGYLIMFTSSASSNGWSFWKILPVAGGRFKRKLPVDCDSGIKYGGSALLLFNGGKNHVPAG